MILIECWFKNTEELTRFVESIERIKGVTKGLPRSSTGEDQIDC